MRFERGKTEMYLKNKWKNGEKHCARRRPRFVVKTLAEKWVSQQLSVLRNFPYYDFVRFEARKSA